MWALVILSASCVTLLWANLVQRKDMEAQRCLGAILLRKVVELQEKVSGKPYTVVEYNPHDQTLSLTSSSLEDVLSATADSPPR